jgi:hypothetical protein
MVAGIPNRKGRGGSLQSKDLALVLASFGFGVNQNLSG